MKSTKTILSCLFAVLVFLSSSTFSVGVHSCGGSVRGIALLDHADGCGHQNMPPCHRKMMKGCCEDAMITYQGQGFSHNLSPVVTGIASFVMVAPPVVLLADVIPAGNHIASFRTDYDPPLPAQDRTVALRTFLI